MFETSVCRGLYYLFLGSDNQIIFICVSFNYLADTAISNMTHER